MEREMLATSGDHDKIIKIEKDVENIKENLASLKEAQLLRHERLMEKLDEMQRYQRGASRGGP
jgi:hypothetical protein